MNEQSPPKKQSPPRKLLRTRGDRYVGGVAAGLARYLEIDPLFVRIAFMVSLAFGGIGLLVYGVLLALMPVEGDPSEPLPPIDGKRRNLMIGAAIIIGAVALVTADAGGFAVWIFGFWPGTVFGILLWVAAGIGVAWLLGTGAFEKSLDEILGRDKPRSGGQDPAEGTPSGATPGTGSGPVAESATSAGPSASASHTHAESPTQLDPTEVIESPAGKAAATGDRDPGSAEPGPSQERPDVPDMIGKIMVWFAIGVTALIVFCLLFVLSGSVTAVFGGVPMAALVIVLGAGMVFAGLRGRRQLSLWLLAAAIAVTVPMAAVSIADLRIEGSYGEINETPLSVVEVPEDGYEMAAGNMTIDLRGFDFERTGPLPSGELELPVRMGMGLTSVIVPDDLCVTGRIEGKAGVIDIRGRQSNGINVSQTATAPSASPGRADPRVVLDIDGEFKLGAFEVVDDTQWRQFGRSASFGQHDLDADGGAAGDSRRRASRACEGPTFPDRQPTGGTRS